MPFLFIRHRVKDFDVWKAVFEADVEMQLKAGFHLRRILRDVDDPATVSVFFEVDDLAEARAFTQAESARDHAQGAGVIGMPEGWWMEEA